MHAKQEEAHRFVRTIMKKAATLSENQKKIEQFNKDKTVTEVEWLIDEIGNINAEKYLLPVQNITV